MIEEIPTLMLIAILILTLPDTTGVIVNTPVSQITSCMTEECSETLLEHILPQ